MPRAGYTFPGPFLLTSNCPFPSRIVQRPAEFQTLQRRAEKGSTRTGCWLLPRAVQPRKNANAGGSSRLLEDTSNMQWVASGVEWAREGRGAKRQTTSAGCARSRRQLSVIGSSSRMREADQSSLAPDWTRWQGCRRMEDRSVLQLRSRLPKSRSGRDYCMTEDRGRLLPPPASLPASPSARAL